MALPNRAPLLRVREARALPSANEFEDLKSFLNSSPPLDEDAFPPYTSLPLGLSGSSQKQGKRRFFGIGKKRHSTSELEPQPYAYGLPTASQATLSGITQRTINGVNVLMIKSRSPPPPLPARGPSLEFTPASPDTVQHALMARASRKYTSPLDAEVKSKPVRPVSSLEPPVVHTARPTQQRGHTDAGVVTIKKFHPHLVTTATDSEVEAAVMVHPVSKWSRQASEITIGSSTVDEHQNSDHSTTPLVLSSTLVKKRLATYQANYTIEPKPSVSTAVDTDHTKSWPESTMPNSDVHESLSTADISSTTEALMPLTPPPSSVQVSPSVHSDVNFVFAPPSKKRMKKSKNLQISPSTLINTHQNLPIEVIHLEAMEDKEGAFNQLVGLYLKQIELREAEQKHHLQQIADLNAGLANQQFEYARLIEVLRQHEIPIQQRLTPSPGTIGPVGFSKDNALPTNTLHLDISRFAMVHKENQYALVRDMSSSSLSVDEDPFNSIELVKRAQTSKSRSPLTPAPSMALPPLPLSPEKQGHANVASRSGQQGSSSPKSESASQIRVSTPYVEAFAIEAKMRSLEEEFARGYGPHHGDASSSPKASHSDTSSISGCSVGLPAAASSEVLATRKPELVTFAPGGLAALTSLASQGSGRGLGISGSCISVSTYETAGSNDADVSRSSSNLEVQVPVKSNESATDQDTREASSQIHSKMYGHSQLRHTIFAAGTSSGSGNSTTALTRPTSIDNSTWGSAFMGFMLRTDGRTCARNEIGNDGESVKSLES